VACGGAAGGLLREAVQVVLPVEPGAWGWSVLVVNAVGGFALAALLAVLARRPSERTRLLVGTGLLGGLTTFSGLVVDAVLLAEAHRRRRRPTSSSPWARCSGRPGRAPGSAVPCDAGAPVTGAPVTWVLR
jgi:fluoride ion exporter CrcB/FEX